MLLKSRSLRMAVASLLLVMGMGVAVPAMADDGIEPYHHVDTDFHFDLSVSGAGMTAGTAGEQKEETSPLFIYPTEFLSTSARCMEKDSTTRVALGQTGRF